MPSEEFTIRITRKGEILVQCEGLPPRRIKNLAELFEETIGPTRILDVSTAEPNPGRVETDIDSKLDKGLEDEGREKQRRG